LAKLRKQSAGLPQKTREKISFEFFERMIDSKLVLDFSTSFDELWTLI